MKKNPVQRLVETTEWHPFWKNMNFIDTHDAWLRDTRLLMGLSVWDKELKTSPFDGFIYRFEDWVFDVLGTIFIPKGDPSYLASSMIKARIPGYSGAWVKSTLLIPFMAIEKFQFVGTVRSDEDKTLPAKQ